MFLMIVVTFVLLMLATALIRSCRLSLSVFTTATSTAARIDDHGFYRYLSDGTDLSVQTDINQLAVTESDHVNGLTVQISDLYAVEIILSQHLSGQSGSLFRGQIHCLGIRWYSV